MNLKTVISTNAPPPLRKALRTVYYGVSTEQHPDQIRNEWKAAFSDYESLARELMSIAEYGEVIATLEALSNAGTIGTDAMTDLYVLVRTEEPEIVVETGVCNGASTFAILAALAANGTGELHSIDYPFFSDVPMARRREETFPGMGSEEIPVDKEPGWVVPDRLRDRWTLYRGKSQELLPEIVAEHPPELFVHDSEHSHPCMMFELETAWHAMDEGIIICDDVGWNGAFEVFTDVRGDVYGKLNLNKGYVRVR